MHNHSPHPRTAVKLMQIVRLPDCRVLCVHKGGQADDMYNFTQSSVVRGAMYAITPAATNAHIIIAKPWETLFITGT